MAETSGVLVLSIRADETAVRGALDMFLANLEPLKLTAEDSARVEIVMAEALNNIIEHAYAPPNHPGPINVFCQQVDDGLHIRIVDHGRAMPGHKTPSGTLPPINVDVMDLPEGGFGWHLIKRLAKDVQYQRTDRMNVLNLRLAVSTV